MTIKEKVAKAVAVVSLKMAKASCGAACPTFTKLLSKT